MQALLHTLCSLLPYHLVCYGGLFGLQIFQTFLNTKIQHPSTSIPDLITLEQDLFPTTCQCQLGIIILTVVTRPPYSIFSFANHHWNAIPLLIILLTATLNWLIFGPRTVSAAITRRSLREQATDGKVADAGDPAGFEPANRMLAVNCARLRRLNVVSLLATLWYGFALSSSLLHDGWLRW
ncbi:hypothetical protein FE257_003985 [Aspergillus nanangensis]|uniref:TMEM205-like domain-containing protein n=1 Tax=Aspergillus nanangensis TaxID=2582783 RepID=A0AAD4CSB7_ASPNN|nr:hypothetical protein FE257_003985 [Aspergillus nanangensis]